MKHSTVACTLAVLVLGPSICFPQQAQSALRPQQAQSALRPQQAQPAPAAQPAPRPPQAAPAPPRDTSPQILDVQGGKIRVVTMATGLFHPWGIAFADANTILVTERSGALRIIRNGALAPQPVWTSPAPAALANPPSQGGQGGNDRLHFVAVHPDFAQNHLVYVSYPKTGEKGSTLAVARGFLKGDTLGDIQEIFVADAWETGGNLAGRIFFGKDKNLYVTIGDRDRICCNAQQLRPDGTDDNTLRMKSQTLDNHVGKTLRLRDDGSVPTDNPFVGKPGAKPEIYTYGHRNGYGLAVHPETGELWQAEIGPMGGDEVNILAAGHNYGWPLVSMGRNYTGSLASDQPFSRPGMDNARMFWVPSISPSSIMFYTGDKFPRWKNNLFVGALTTRQLIRVAFGQPSQAERREGLLIPLSIRVRDVQQSPDGYIYVATEGASGGNASDGMVLKIEPVE
jgi:glucose/arabinose dehydrogenase